MAAPKSPTSDTAPCTVQRVPTPIWPSADHLKFMANAVPILPEPVNTGHSAWRE